jgi:aspartate/methionine/tyrosine aminotransferase
MDISRSGLESWFNQEHPGTRFDFGGTMVPAPRDHLAALWRPEFLSLGYPATTGSEDARSKIAGVEGLTASDLILTCGATEANAAVLLAAIEPGAEVLVQHPLYYQFEPLLASHGAVIRRWDPVAAAEPPVGPATRLVVVNAPHNPTGRVVDVSAVVKLAEALPACRVLVDEVYRNVSADGLETAALLSERVVVTNSFAKRWGMPGLRLGWLASRDPVFRDRAHAWHHYLAHSAPASSERLIVGLWPELQVVARENQVIAERNVGMLAAWLAQMGDLLEGAAPEAGVTTIVRPAGREGPVDDVGLARQLRHDFGIFTLPGSYVGYPEWLRIGVGNREADALTEALAQLEGALRTLAARKPQRTAHPA